jgi:hypothetical protein
MSAVTMPVPERDASFEADVWNQLRARLPQQQPAKRWSWLAMPQRWAVAGAFAVLLVCAFLLGRWSRPPGTVAGNSGIQAVSEQAARDRVLLVAVGDHLDRTQMILVELVNTRPGRSVDISAEQSAARQLLDDNRLYRQTAAQMQDRAVADLLDQLERTLVDLSHRPTTLSASEFEDIRQRIEAQGLLFKVRIIGSEVRDRERETRAQPGLSQKAKS